MEVYQIHKYYDDEDGQDTVVGTYASREKAESLLFDLEENVELSNKCVKCPLQCCPDGCTGDCCNKTECTLILVSQAKECCSYFKQGIDKTNKGIYCLNDCGTYACIYYYIGIIKVIE